MKLVLTRLEWTALVLAVGMILVPLIPYALGG
jgi:hypothetical protein